MRCRECPAHNPGGKGYGCKIDAQDSEIIEFVDGSIGCCMRAKTIIKKLNGLGIKTKWRVTIKERKNG